jgi:uncharacterized protein
VPNLLLLAVVGLVAQLVDGSLGMGYGATSATLLLAVGFTPVAASASVHLAEVGTTFVSGLSHWRYGNVDWRIATWLAIPGALGALVGAFALSAFPADLAKPAMAIILFALGVYIVIRFTTGRAAESERGRPLRRRYVTPLGLFGGFIDSVGGGGWGAVSTSTLLATGRMEPRRVVGTVDASEFVVSVSASVGFLVALASQAIAWPTVIALLAGGLVAAPIAAALVRRMEPRILGTAVGGAILFTNARQLMTSAGINGIAVPLVYVSIAVALAVALAMAVASVRGQRLSSLSRRDS